MTYGLDDQNHESSKSRADELYFNVKKLRRITQMIEVISIVSFGSLIGLLVVIAMMSLSVRSRSALSVDELSAISNTLFVLTLLSLLFYERLRRNGDTLFTELSDELQWRLNLEHSALASDRSWELGSSELDRSVRPPLSMRVVLRSFVKNTDLPLTRGAAGTQVYLLIGIVLWITSLVIGVYSKSVF